MQIVFKSCAGSIGDTSCLRRGDVKMECFGELSIYFMSLKRVQVGMSEEELARLDRLARKYGFTHSGAMRFCFNKVADDEEIPHEKKASPSRR